MADYADKRILVVDDEEDVREYLSMALADAGFQVETAAGGDEAFDRVQQNPPDLISLDLVMPKGSGARFHRRMKRDPRLRHIPIILVTGHARDEEGRTDFEELTMSGTGVYLEKPVKPASYVRAVCTLLGIDLPDSGGELSGEPGDEASLRAELYRTLAGADADALAKALAVLKKEK
ncbi:MAG: Phosphate regulon transcriptional regulatory protein PhoB [Calditrichaeota bacterium]|nr:Phosphate regulon transcriptional regulatory protein PhoB [Calditrichota bacterium]